MDGLAAAASQTRRRRGMRQRARERILFMASMSGQSRGRKDLDERDDHD